MSAMKSEARALRATIARLHKIDNLLLEIAGLWGDVDESIIRICDDLRDDVLTALVNVNEIVDDRRYRQVIDAEERDACHAGGRR